MKIIYESVTGERVELEVNERVGEVIIELERIEHNKDRAETRRHSSIEYVKELGVQLEDKTVNIAAIVETNEELNALYNAINKLLPQQQELVRKIYFEEKSLTQIALEEGVNKSSVYRRLKRIHEQFKKYLD